jgi:hypothetical protein
VVAAAIKAKKVTIFKEFPMADEYDEDFESRFEDDDDLIDGVGFADPGGRSALRAATPNNPRNRPCPSCGRENVLTRIDVQRHYQCDNCADRAEGRMGGDY